LNKRCAGLNRVKMAHRAAERAVQCDRRVKRVIAGPPVAVVCLPPGKAAIMFSLSRPCPCRRCVTVTGSLQGNATHHQQALSPRLLHNYLQSRRRWKKLFFYLISRYLGKYFAC
jgi:hypothetical protein